MREKELPMYSPHPRAKLYRRYTYKTSAHAHVLEDPDDLTTATEIEKFVVELNNYCSHESFKWVFETELQTNQQEQIPGLINKSVYVTIKTNTLEYINPGDVVWLQCGMWKQGKYFIVTGDVKQDYIYTPKMRQSYKHLELRSLL